jgi:hypothetical protein
MTQYHIRTINELPHREVSDGDRAIFADGDIFEVENREFEDDIYIYILRKILKSGAKGKTNWIVTYTTKTGMKASCHR